MRIVKLDETGDTIVEVIIAMGILTFIIIGAYVTTNISTTQQDRSGQRDQALQLAQSQIELLKAMSLQGTVIPNWPSWCIYANGASLIASKNPVASPTPYSPSNFTGNCNVNTADLATPTQPFFSVSIQQILAGNFTIQVNWYGTGGGIDNVTLGYRTN